MGETTPFSLQDADLSSLFIPGWARKGGGSQHSLPSFHQKEEKKEHLPFKKKAPLKRRGENFSYQKKEEIFISGWKIQLLPEARGVEEVAKQIRKEMKAYSLFEIARLLLAKPQRYHIKWRLPASALHNHTPLFQCTLDETLWLSEEEVLAHAFSTYHDRYYRLEKKEVEVPKGSYTSVAVCGMSQILLGPPNHHEYQQRIRRIHAERFAHLPLEAFKNRIQMSRDETLLEQWKEAQRIQEVFYSRASVEEERVGLLEEAQKHFKKTYASAIIQKVTEGVVLSQAAAWQHSSSVIRKMIEGEIELLKQFPLSFSQEVGQALAMQGLQLFKAHGNVVYVSIARPRSFSQGERNLSDSLKDLVNLIKEQAGSSRAEQWKILVASRSAEAETKESEASLIKDLSWLLHEGYIINYASKRFEVA